jgi:hypothetical protein
MPRTGSTSPPMSLSRSDLGVAARRKIDSKCNDVLSSQQLARALHGTLLR